MDETDDCENSAFGLFSTFCMFPVLTDAMFRRSPLDSNYFPLILIYLFLVTSLGVPQSITLLNLLSIGFSSSFASLVIAYDSTFFLVWGANNYFLSAAMRFCFSVSTGSSLFTSDAAAPFCYS
jgi:hypothetical protein